MKIIPYKKWIDISLNLLEKTIKKYPSNVVLWHLKERLPNNQIIRGFSIYDKINKKDFSYNLNRIDINLDDNHDYSPHPLYFIKNEKQKSISTIFNKLSKNTKKITSIFITVKILDKSEDGKYIIKFRDKYYLIYNSKIITRRFDFSEKEDTELIRVYNRRLDEGIIETLASLRGWEAASYLL